MAVVAGGTAVGIVADVAALASAGTAGVAAGTAVGVVASVAAVASAGSRADVAACVAAVVAADTAVGVVASVIASASAGNCAGVAANVAAVVAAGTAVGIATICLTLAGPSVQLSPPVYNLRVVIVENIITARVPHPVAAILDAATLPADSLRGYQHGVHITPISSILINDAKHLDVGVERAWVGVTVHVERLNTLHGWNMDGIFLLAARGVDTEEQHIELHTRDAQSFTEIEEFVNAMVGQVINEHSLSNSAFRHRTGAMGLHASRFPLAIHACS